MRERRIAVTGLGVECPLGHCVDELFANLAAGRSGIRVLPESLSQGLRCQVGAPAEFDGSMHFPAPRLRMLDRVSQLALTAAAVEDMRGSIALLKRRFVSCFGWSESTCG